MSSRDCRGNRAMEGDMEEGMGESSSPPRTFAPPAPASEIKKEVYMKLVESGNPEAVNPEFREQLDAHFGRLPASYALDVNADKAEDVLIHRRILAEAKDLRKRPVFHVRFKKGFGIDFDPCSKLEDLDLDVRKGAEDTEDEMCLTEALSARQEVTCLPVHEIVFSTIDRPKLLSKLSALLSDIGLNIREAHVFSTSDGYSLDVFSVDGWPHEDTDGLHKMIEEAITRYEGLWAASSQSSAAEILAAQPKVGDWEIDKSLLTMSEKIASGASGDLYHGTYLGEDVAIKILRSEHLTDAQGVEFAQEVLILREVQHVNVVRFVGACTKPPQLCILTEYMPGGSLYDFLHKHPNTLDLSMLLKFALDVCKGMDYLHQNNIIHRDLKTANLLMDKNHVIKVADFGVARFQSQPGVMTAETGTYRWMAPEVMNHKPYDQKADVFSFAIVLWELATSKIPYDKMTPLQAAVGVRQGLRPELPLNADPRVLDLMQRCWETVPAKRPTFREITVELEKILRQVQVTEENK